MQSMPRLRTSQWVIVLALVVVLLLASGIWLRLSRAEEATGLGQQSLSNASNLVPMARPPRFTALFLGDDFAAGNEGAYTYAYPYIVCDILNLNCNVDAQSGTGFLSGRSGAPAASRLIDRLPRDRRIYDADLVVVDAGRNDVAAGPDALGQAMSQYLSEVKQLWPAAHLVVLAPSPFSNEPATDYGEVLSVIGPIVESFGGVTIDPVAEGWYDGTDLTKYQTADGLHPNQGGHQLIAQKLAESLLKHQLVETPRAVK